MSQYELPPFQSHSDTSIEASIQIKSKAKNLELAVYKYIVERDKNGATDYEIQTALNLSVQTQVPRRRSLQIKGKVRDSGYRRKTNTGRKAVVWIYSNLPGFEQGPHISLKDRLKQAERKIYYLEAENNKLKEQLKTKQMKLF